MVANTRPSEIVGHHCARVNVRRRDGRRGRKSRDFNTEVRDSTGDGSRGVFDQGEVDRGHAAGCRFGARNGGNFVRGQECRLVLGVVVVRRRRGRVAAAARRENGEREENN